MPCQLQKVVEVISGHNEIKVITRSPPLCSLTKVGERQAGLGRGGQGECTQMQPHGGRALRKRAAAVPVANLRLAKAKRE